MSPDHTKLAWAADDLGSELLTLRARDLATGQDLDDRVVNAGSDIVWTRDATGFLYVEQDESHRPFRVMLHRLGTEQGEDVEIFAEPDPAWFIGVSGSLTGRAAMIDVHGHDGSETHIVDLGAPTARPLLVAPRRPGHFYDVLDHGERVFIRTNAAARATSRSSRRRAPTPSRRTGARSSPIATAAISSTPSRSPGGSFCWRARRAARG